MAFFNCCSGVNREASFGGSIELPASIRGMRVELVATSLLGLGGTVGWHTSVMVNGTEYYFDYAGINVSPVLESHEGDDTTTTFVGYSTLSGSAMVSILEQHFRANTYDKLRKNCNSFSDCALYLLCGKRLPTKLGRAERFGRVLDEKVASLERLLGEGFARNNAADDFDIDSVINSLDCWRVPLVTQAPHSSVPDVREMPEDEIPTEGPTRMTSSYSFTSSSASSCPSTPREAPTPTAAYLVPHRASETSIISTSSAALCEVGSVCSTSAGEEDPTFSLEIGGLQTPSAKKGRTGSLEISLAFSDADDDEDLTPAVQCQSIWGSHCATKLGEVQGECEPIRSKSFDFPNLVSSPEAAAEVLRSQLQAPAVPDEFMPLML
mmetsp:Transcript_33075/g.70962  ORF Transcript_33075/g.70962 Transcript_33075/m.70962 type:complete len:380 (-) Transcript_33075:39-1178(-)